MRSEIAIKRQLKVLFDKMDTTTSRIYHAKLFAEAGALQWVLRGRSRKK